MITAVVIVALVVCLVGAVAVSRGMRLVDYTSGRSTGTRFQITMTLLGTLVGGFMFFGLPAMGYEAGLAGAAIGVGYGIGLTLLACSARKMKRLCNQYQVDTIDDLMLCRYGQKTQILSSAVNLVVFLAILSAQFIAIDAFLRIFTDIDHNLTLYLAVVVVLIYTTLSGFRGVILTDVYQVLILAICAVVIFWMTSSETPLERLRDLDPSYFNGTGYGTTFLVGVVVLFPLSLFCRSDLWQRTACAKNARVMRQAYFLVIPLLLGFYFILTMLGIYAAANPNGTYEKETAGLQNFLDILNESGLGGAATTTLTAVLALGVFAALLSTADSYLNLVATSMSKVLRRHRWQEFEAERSASVTELERSLLRTTRFLCLGLGCAAVVLAKVIPDIVDLLVGAISILFVLLPSVLSALFSTAAGTDDAYQLVEMEGRGAVRVPHAQGNAYAASTSIVVGVIAYVAASMLMEEAKSAFLPGTLASVLSYILVRRIWPGEHPHVEDLKIKKELIDVD